MRGAGPRSMEARANLSAGQRKRWERMRAAGYQSYADKQRAAMALRMATQVPCDIETIADVEWMRVAQCRCGAAVCALHHEITPRCSVCWAADIEQATAIRRRAD